MGQFSDEKKNSINDPHFSEALKKLMELFYQSTGIGLSLSDLNLNTIEKVGWQHICTHFHHKSPEAQLGCRESELFFLKNMSVETILEHKCNNGLYDLGVPIMQNGKHVANLLFGQLLYRDEIVDKKFFVSQAEKFGFDIGQYLDSLKKVPVLPREKVLAHVRFFSTVVTTLLQYANHENIVSTPLDVP